MPRTWIQSFRITFGRTPVGPLSLLKDTWLSQQTVLPNKKHVFQFVNYLTDKLHKTMQDGGWTVRSVRASLYSTYKTW